jgi:prepilin-type processing-associated H-X9-DG protein
LFINVICECGHQFEMPEGNAGLYASCPACARILIVPGPARPRPVESPETIYIPDEPPRVSRTAIASLVFGLAFFFACFSGTPAILLGVQALGDINRSGGRLRGRKQATAGIVLGVFGCLFTLALLMPAYRSAGEAARRSQCVNNLKQIGLAMYNYHEVHGSLPPAAIVGKDGRPLLSWRVALLPYLEANDLYSTFHLDEPWDSPHNLSLLDKMPGLYKCPSDDTLKPGMTGYQAIIKFHPWFLDKLQGLQPGTTGYQAAIGPGTAFTPDFKPLKFEDFTDGTSNTILIGESRRSVPWTKPEDLPFDMNIPLTGLGSHHGYHNNGFNVLFTDGSVRFIKNSIDPQILRSLLTRDGKEVYAVDPY